MTRPRRLHPGDTLGIVAPASPFDREAFDTGVGVLEKMGFKLVFPDGLFARRGYLAGSDRQRADQLTRLFCDPNIDGIICARGGYGSMRVLPLLDPALIAKHPKVFVGFSDITALLAMLVERCRMVAFHGPTVTTLGKGDLSSQERLLAALTSPDAIALAAKPVVTLQAGRASGPLFCANLAVLDHLTGTPFAPDLTGRILLIEDRGEAPYRIDRMLVQMRLAGCFDGLAGLALGQFTDCGPTEEVLRVVADCFDGMSIPILAGFPVGHEDANHTVPVGLPATLDTVSGTLTMNTTSLE